MEENVKLTKELVIDQEERNVLRRRNTVLLLESVNTRNKRNVVHGKKFATMEIVRLETRNVE